MVGLWLQVVDDPDAHDVRTVVRELVAFNTQRAGVEGHRPLTVFVRGPDSEVLGGALGYTHWTWLFVSHLWVADTLRGQGWGERLVSALEHAAVERGCRNAHVDTFSFQAPGFYERLGYTRFGELADYPPGFTRIFLRKPLG